MAFVMWIVALGEILTLDNTRRHGIIVINLFCMCRKSEVMMGHLLYIVRLQASLEHDLLYFVDQSCNAFQSGRAFNKLKREI